jgi:hypothetical protein
MITTLYDTLSARNYKEYSTCQLPGCSNDLKKTSKQKVAKYCCADHARKAKLLYIKEWKLRNKDRVKIWNNRYAKKRWKKVLSGEIPNPNFKKHENKKNKTD